MFKVGSQLFTAAGPELVREIVGRGERVFLDLKFHDIPNTVPARSPAPRGSACRSSTSTAWAARAMIEAAVGALPARGTRLLAITILTSHDEQRCAEIGLDGAVHDVGAPARAAREGRGGGRRRRAPRTRSA